MANQWLRLWHDMPTDPKWRTVARVSGQRIGDVIAVYVHLLVCASNATERGRTQSFNCEDAASALDLETDQVSAIVAAMQGRVLDGDRVQAWEKRQAAREDGSAERSRAWREAKKAGLNADETPSTDVERNRTQTERKETPDKTKKREEDKTPLPPGGGEGRFPEFWDAWPKSERKQDRKRCAAKWVRSKLDSQADVILAHVEASKATRKWRDGFEPAPLTYLNGERWLDGAPTESEQPAAEFI